MKSRYYFLPLLLLLLLAWLTPAAAQSPELSLRLSRDWGYGGPNGDIQGTFSFHAKGPENLAAVEFYIDDTLVGRVEEPPWKLRFVTDAYPLGQHELYAIGYTDDGQTIKSNVLVQNFVPASAAWEFIIKFGIPILLLALGVPALLHWIDRKRNPAKYSGYGGAFGGAICPNCGCPFPRHWWGLNFGGKKYDRCPHCHKWSMVERVSEEKLKEAAIDCGLEAPVTEAVQTNSEESLQKRLDESRYFPED
jgi:hypothetical protein